MSVEIVRTAFLKCNACGTQIETLDESGDTFPEGWSSTRAGTYHLCPECAKKAFPWMCLSCNESFLNAGAAQHHWEQTGHEFFLNLNTQKEYFAAENGLFGHHPLPEGVDDNPQGPTREKQA